MSHNKNREELLVELGTNRRLAHAVLFSHRHPDPTPDFHQEIIQAWHSDHPRVVTEAFRDGGKSTVGEEVFIIKAALREFRNGIILGSSETRAKERLLAIKTEIETNEYLEELFGTLAGSTWGETNIVLSNGVAIRAYGSGQSLRGAKHLEQRPDFAWIDDLEDEETVKTPEARTKMLRWLYRAFMPALAKGAQIRFTGNRLDPEAVIVQVAKDKGWRHQRYPIMHQVVDGKDLPDLPPGRWAPTWPGKYDLPWVASKRQEYIRMGLLSDFNCEYMCEADDPETKTFRSEMIKVRPRVRTWEATYAVYDPARTIKASSASTGKVVFSWIGNRLIIWDGGGYLWRPDELIDDLFRTDDEFRPIAIGVEDTGLNEWVLQPLRQQQVLRSQSIPLRALNAPRDKLSFIRGLQPFFKAGEVEFAQDLPEAKAQLLGFPTGRIDFPNALAYALMMRPGQPIYDTFTHGHIAQDLALHSREPVWLAVNATAQFTAAQLVQVIEGGLHVIVDWLREGDPGSCLNSIVASAGLEAGTWLRVCAPRHHLDGYDTIGLRVAAGKIPVDLRYGASPQDGREELRRLLTLNRKSIPLLQVSSRARWTLNAFAGGYARKVEKTGMLADEPLDGPYKVFMEGLESFASLLRTSVLRKDEDVRMETAPDGRRYMSAMATRG